MNRVSQVGAAATRRRSPLFATVILTAAVAASGAGAALAASHASLSLTGRTIVQYTRSDKLTGALSSGKKGALVELQQRVWPFKQGFKTVAKTHTGAGGTYRFKRRPSLATQYRAVAPRSHAKSRIRTVYVVKGFKLLRCVITHRGYTHPGCGTQTVPPGHYKWEVTFELLYPASVYKQESGKPVYAYYAIRHGSQTPPSTLKRQRNLRQHAHKGNGTIVNFVKKFVITHAAYDQQGNFCTKTSERTDGFGLPGAPGSHMCGAKRIPGNTPIYKLG